MPEQQAVLDPSVLDASPTVESPDSGLGANATEQAKPPAWEKLQSERDKERARRERIEAQNAELAARLQQLEAEKRAPDPTLEPEKSADYWKQVAQQGQTVLQSEIKIASELIKFARETGIVVDRSDERLDLKAGGPEGWRRFKASLKAIEDEVKAPEKQAASIDKLVEQKLAERLKAAGLDTFDGGSGVSGGAAQGVPRTLAEIRNLTPEQYVKHKDAIKELWRNGQLRR